VYPTTRGRRTTEEWLAELGTSLRQRRLRAELTQEDLARLADLGLSSVKHLESGAGRQPGHPGQGGPGPRRRGLVGRPRASRIRPGREPHAVAARASGRAAPRRRVVRTACTHVMPYPPGRPH
jgi:hypothetical protein